MVRRLVAAAVALAAVAGAGAARADCTIGKLAELPVTMAGSKPLIDAKINGQDVQMVVDTGAFYSVLTTTGARRLGLKLEPAPSEIPIGGFGGEVADVHATRAKTLGLGGGTFPDMEFFVANLALGPGVVGLLGQNVLHAADVEYDFAHGVMRFFAPKGCERTSLAYWAKPDQVGVVGIESTKLGDDHVTGTVSVNGAHITAMFDTGAGESVLSAQSAGFAGVPTSDAATTEGGVLGGLGRGGQRTRIAPVKSFEIGGEEVRNTRMRVSLGPMGGGMILGADFFLSHRVLISNSQKRIYFTYNGGPIFDLSPQGDGRSAGSNAASQRISAAPAAAAEDLADADALAARASAAAVRGDLRRAKADLDKAITLKPETPRYRRQRAVVEERLGDLTGAETDLDAAVRAAPKDGDARSARAALRFHRKDIRGFREDLDVLEGLTASDPDLRTRVIALYEEGEMYDQAIAQMDQWLIEHPREGGTGAMLNSRCWTRALTGRGLDFALADCNAALAMTALSSNAAILDSRGLVNLRAGRYDAAIADYDLALRKDPKLAWSLYGRGVAELKKGLKAQGEADIAASAALDPKVAERAKRLGVGA